MRTQNQNLNKKLDWYEDLLTSLLDCGYGDLERLIEFLEFAEKLGIEINFYQLIDDARDIAGLKAIDLNDLLYAVMNTIFIELIQDFSIEEQEILRDNFNPFVNYLDTHFNNPLDELVYKENVKRENAIKVLRKWLKDLKLKHSVSS